MHYILVSIALGLRHPDRALRRDSHDEVDFLAQDLVSHRVFITLIAPAATSEISLWHPSLVDVDDVGALIKQSKHLACIEVAEHQAPLRVALEDDPLNATVAESEAALEFSSHLFD